MLARPAFLTAMLLASSSIASAGTTYRITSKDGEKAVEYRVDFGGAKRFERWTAFNFASKTFVYLDFPRGSGPPAPAARIWDHRTGETDKFRAASSALEDMKVCPVTGDRAFTSGRSKLMTERSFQTDPLQKGPLILRALSRSANSCFRPALELLSKRALQERKNRGRRISFRGRITHRRSRTKMCRQLPGLC